MIGNVTRSIALIGLASLIASPVCAQPGGTKKPDAVVEKPAVLEINPKSGSLKETVQKGQELIWRGKEAPNDVLFALTNISVALLRAEAGGQVRITFSGSIASRGYRTSDEAKLNLVARTKGGSALYTWSFGVAVACTDENKPLTPLTHDVPNEVAASVFSNVNTIELAEYTEPNVAGMKVQRCG